MRFGLGDIVPLNIPAGATQLTQEQQGSGWMLQNGWWVWVGPGTPNLTIPITGGPGIPSNSGWVMTPGGSSVWTGPGTQPNVLPPTAVIPLPTGAGVPVNGGWQPLRNGRHMWTGPGYAPANPPGALLHVPAAAMGVMHNWTPQPIIPDSMLPPVIRRNNSPAQATWTPNKYDFAIIAHAKKWQWIAAHGGLKSCCRVPELGGPIYDVPPWEKKPDNAEVFSLMNALPVTAFQTAGVFNGLDTEILNIRVPSGYDGVVKSFVATIGGGLSGYNDFEGDIFWRLQYGIRYVKTLGNVQNTFGSLSNALDAPEISMVRVISGQTISVSANVPAGSPIAGGVIGAGVFGWFYPRR
jgi:hypothetical protein